MAFKPYCTECKTWHNEGEHMIVEIIGPSGRVHYRRPVGDPMIEEAARTPGYSIREVEQKAPSQH